MVGNYISATVVGLAMIGSCATQDNMGYPNKVTFPKTGGEKTIYGNYPIGGLGVKDYDGNYFGGDAFDREIPYEVKGDSIYYMDGHVAVNCQYWEDPRRYTHKDTIFYHYDWLTFKHVKDSHSITLTAAPNDTRKHRKLYLICWDETVYLDICVSQNK